MPYTRKSERKKAERRREMQSMHFKCYTMLYSLNYQLGKVELASNRYKMAMKLASGKFQSYELSLPIPLNCAPFENFDRLQLGWRFADFSVVQRRGKMRRGKVFGSWEAFQAGFQLKKQNWRQKRKERSKFSHIFTMVEALHCPVEYEPS